MDRDHGEQLCVRDFNVLSLSLGFRIVFLGTRLNQVSYWVIFLYWAELSLAVIETQPEACCRQPCQPLPLPFCWQCSGALWALMAEPDVTSQLPPVQTELDHPQHISRPAAVVGVHIMRPIIGVERPLS